MSEESQEPVKGKKDIPNPFGWLRVRRQDEKMQGIRDLISSDKNNPTKTRKDNPFGWTVFQTLGVWSSPLPTIKYTVGDIKKEVPKTVSGIAEYFFDKEAENAISYKGDSRIEYVQALSSYLAQQLMTIQGAQESRVNEGAGPGKKR